MFGLKDSESKGLRVLGKIYGPSHLLAEIDPCFRSGAFINRITADVSTQLEVFVDGIN